MRRLIFALALACVLPAAAQTAPANPSPEATQRAASALAAIWRAAPEQLTAQAIASACVGALDEIADVERALPASLSPENLTRIRAPSGLLIVPSGEDPSSAFFFAPPSLPWFTSGLGTITVISEADGFLGVRDAGGREIAFQLGRAGRQAVLRVRPPEGEVLNFVGCAPTTG